jgi:hypothetical protein
MSQYNRFVRIVLFLATIVAVSVPNLATAQAPPTKVDFDCVGSPLSLEDSLQAYNKFRRGDNVKSADGYGIYTKYRIRKNMIKVDENGGVSLTFDVGDNEDYAKMYGSAWYSIRREFKSILDLSKAKGIVVTITTNKTSQDIRLRLTLSDYNRPSGRHMPKYRDGMWVNNLPKSVLRTTGVATLKIPFTEFKRAKDEGSRPGIGPDFRPEDTIAYEINVLGVGWVDFKVERVACYVE